MIKDIPTINKMSKDEVFVNGEPMNCITLMGEDDETPNLLIIPKTKLDYISTYYALRGFYSVVGDKFGNANTKSFRETKSDCILETDDSSHDMLPIGSSFVIGLNKVKSLTSEADKVRFLPLEDGIKVLNKQGEDILTPMHDLEDDLRFLLQYEHLIIYIGGEIGLYENELIKVLVQEKDEKYYLYLEEKAKEE